ncbi:replication protein A 70 kDa DNA-binding subunit B [Artemisia annua]|uniref:Replication protein A 70 kDa DNA-binding subunit B n=1 Tax=Artemisia annua TaxID=35608 RepID=A0A2U1LWL5_ARTAN|nr:replication protein A 70 kDa DNA-binding subunit B [Artemisia annua]
MKFISLNPLLLLYVDDAAALLKATTTSAKQKGVLSEPEDAAFVTNTTKNDKGRTRVKCTFWDNWAHMFTQYATKKESAGTVSFVLQLAKVKYYNNDPAVHNSLFGSRIFINKDVPALLSFKERYTSKDGYDDSQHKIELFTPQKVNITPEVFFANTVACKVGGIRDVAPGSEVVVYAKIHRIHKEHGWCYDACKKCNKIAKPIKTAGSKGTSGNGKKQAYQCDGHGTIYQLVPRFKVIVRVIDETGSAPLVMFDTNVSKLCNGTSAYEIVNSVNRDPTDYFPEESSAIVGKKILLKVLFTQQYVNSNSHVYTCKSVSDESELIEFYKGLITSQTEDGDEVLNTPEINAINEMSGAPKSDLHVTKFVLDTPPAQAALSATASRSGSGSGKVTGKRQVIDLDDYPDVELIVPDNKKPLLEVKIGKE